MRINILLPCCVAILLYGCPQGKQPDKVTTKNKDAKRIVSGSGQVAIKPVANDTLNHRSFKTVPDTMINSGPAPYADKIDFEKFATSVYSSSKKAPLNFERNKEAWSFRTRIKEAYNSMPVDFAGYYVCATFGCGADCIMGFMVDVRDGKIYTLPLGEENYCSFSEDRAVCGASSRLFIANICKKDDESDKVHYKAFLWDEHKKVFEVADENIILKSR